MGADMAKTPLKEHFRLGCPAVGGEKKIGKTQSHICMCLKSKGELEEQYAFPRTAHRNPCRDYTLFNICNSSEDVGVEKMRGMLKTVVENLITSREEYWKGRWSLSNEIAAIPTELWRDVVMYIVSKIASTLGELLDYLLHSEYTMCFFFPMIAICIQTHLQRNS